jgi:Pyruvate/2-oxoglutarate dehydrogenase complex, dehydrogenase (E1) component, eukaryotic type, alpha subunit
MCIFYLEFYYADILTYIFGLCWSYSFLQNLENKIRVSVDEVVKKAKSDKEIGLEELVTDIYADSKEPIVRGATPWDRYQHKTLGTAVNV